MTTFLFVRRLSTNLCKESTHTRPHTLTHFLFHFSLLQLLCLEEYRTLGCVVVVMVCCCHVEWSNVYGGGWRWDTWMVAEPWWRDTTAILRNYFIELTNNWLPRTNLWTNNRNGFSEDIDDLENHHNDRYMILYAKDSDVIYGVDCYNCSIWCALLDLTFVMQMKICRHEHNRYY